MDNGQKVITIAHPEHSSGERTSLKLYAVVSSSKLGALKKHALQNFKYQTLKCQSRMQQTTLKISLNCFSEEIRIDISYELST